MNTPFCHLVLLLPRTWLNLRINKHHADDARKWRHPRTLTLCSKNCLGSRMLHPHQQLQCFWRHDHFPCPRTLSPRQKAHTAIDASPAIIVYKSISSPPGDANDGAAQLILSHRRWSEQTPSSRPTRPFRQPCHNPTRGRRWSPCPCPPSQRTSRSMDRRNRRHRRHPSA